MSNRSWVLVLMSIVLAIQEAKIRRISVQSHPWANSLGDPISKISNTKKDLAEWLKQ
jgi:hypothetical protein